MKIFFLSIIKQYGVYVVMYIPLLWMVLNLSLNINNWDLFLSYAGYLSVGFLIVTLSLNPLKSIFGWYWVVFLNRYRRALGIASFLYATLHLGCFIIKRILINGFWDGLVYFFHPGIIPAFWVAWPILIILTITSHDYFVKKMKYKRWKSLHKSVYIAQIAIMVHLILTDHVWLMLSLFMPLMVLQYMRWKKVSFQKSAFTHQL